VPGSYRRLELLARPGASADRLILIVGAEGGVRDRPWKMEPPESEDSSGSIALYISVLGGRKGIDPWDPSQLFQ
jgi:hypothetical protein